MHTNKSLVSVLLTLVLCLYFTGRRAEGQAAKPQAAVTAHVDHTGLGKLGWQLACQAQTFSDVSFMEMIDQLHAQVFHHVELAPGQALSAEHADVKIDASMSPADVDAINAKLKAVKMDIVSYGVVHFISSEADARKQFEFAKKLKAKNIVADPDTGSLEMLDKLATEYAINVAIVNGDKGSAFADCDTLLKAMTGRSNRLGACADLGNWKKSGLLPLDCVKKLGAKVLEIRLSDVDDAGNPAVLGAGSVNPAPVLEYLKGRNFKGIFAVQYLQGGGQEQVNNFYRSVTAFSEVVSKLAGTHE